MTQHQTIAAAGSSVLPTPFHLSTMGASLAEARRFYTGILGCEERRATKTSAHFDFFGSQLTVHEVAEYNASNLHREVDAEDVPVPHFGAALPAVKGPAVKGRLTSTRS